MVIKKSSKAKDKLVKKSPANVKAVATKKVETKNHKDDKSGKACKIKNFASKLLSAIKNNKQKIKYSVILVLILGFAPTYCYTAKKVAESYENSDGYKRAVFGWLKVVMSRKPNSKIKLEGDNLTAYNAIKDYALKIANVYPSLRNLQIKASILTPVDSMGAIDAYMNIINRSGKYEWCPICQGLVISKSEKENYRYYFEIARLYEKMGNKEQAEKYIAISIEKFNKDSNYSSNKKISKLLSDKQAEIKKMSKDSAKKEKLGKSKIKAVVKKAVMNKEKAKSKKK